MDTINQVKNFTILFIPEVAIYPFTRGLVVLGDAVKKNRGDVFITKCSGQMIRCPIMSMHRVSAVPSNIEKSRICKKCLKYFQKIQKNYNFSPIDLSKFIDEKKFREIDNIASIESENIVDIIFKDFPVGKIAQYDFILETKYPYSDNLSKKNKEIYLSYIKNTALTIVMMENIINHYKPSLLITFNEYAQSQAVRYVAKINNIRRMAMTYPVHFNIDTSRFMIWKSTCEYWRYKHCQKWQEIKNISIKANDVLECWNDTIFRMYGIGSHIFSLHKKDNPSGILKKIKLNLGKKIVIAYTSSQDERKSVEIAMKIWTEDNHITDAFSDQIEWLNMLRNYAKSRNDIQIVVRIHPREGKKQFGFDSEHLKQLKEKFVENNPNFIIIWPDDPISSYDLMELADICLVSWSLMGQEAARLGIPVLSCTGNMFYPDDDFIQVATNPEEYKQKLDAILNMKYNWQHLLKAVRFYHWRTFIPSLDLSETVPSDFEDTSIWPEAPISKIEVLNDILSGKQDLIEYNIKQWEDSLPIDATFRESEAMRQGIRFFLDKIFYPPKSYGKIIDKMLYICGKIWRKFIRRRLYKIINKKYISNRNDGYKSFIDYDLEFTTDVSQSEEMRKRTKQDKNFRIVLANGMFATLIHRGKMLSRMSPMVIKLASLHADSLKNKD